MRRGSALAAAVLLSLLGVAFWLGGMFRIGPLSALRTHYQVRLEPGTVITDNRLDDLAETEKGSYALAREEEGNATANLFGRTLSMTLLEVKGDPALLFPLEGLLHGHYPEAENDCVIDGESAREFWGDSASVGQEIVWNNKTYRVCGVLDASRPVLVVRPAPGKEFSPGLAVYRPSGEEAFPVQGLDAFLRTLALEERGQRNLNRTALWLRAALLLPPWLFAMSFAWRGLRRLFRWWVPRWGGLAVCGWLLGKGIGFPSLLTPEMLPTRWSDFSFWRTHLEKLGERIFAGFAAPGSLPEYLLLWDWVLPALGFSLASLLCFFTAIRIIGWLFAAPYHWAAVCHSVSSDGCLPAFLRPPSARHRNLLRCSGGDLRMTAIVDKT